jgi:hypothetical protein
LCAAVVASGVAKYGSQTHQIVKFAGAVAVVVLLGVAAVRPEKAIVAFVALSALDAPNTLFGVRVRISEELLLAMALILLPRVPASYKDLPRWPRIGLVLLTGGGILAAVSAQRASTAAWGATKYAAFAVIVIVGTSLCRHNTALRTRIAVAFLAVTSVTALLGLLQGWGHNTIVGAPYLAGLPNSLLGYYTDYAAFIGMGFAVGAALLFSHAKRLAPSTLAILGALVLLAFAIAEAKSRGGVVTALAGLIIAPLGRGSIFKYVTRGMVVAAVAASIYIVMPSHVTQPVMQRITDHSLTVYEDQQRHGLQTLGLSLLKAHPLGIGYGNFPFYEPSSLYFSTGLPDFHDQETVYQLGLDCGWVGLAGAGVIAVSAARRLLRHRSDPVVVAGAAALVGLAAQGLNDYVIYDAPLLMAAGFMLLLIFGTPPSTDKDEEQLPLAALSQFSHSGRAD